MTKQVAVIGAGIVGACIAFALVKRGARVVLIDRDEPGRACSYGNLGAISESSIAPLAMPGIVSTLPAMLSDRDSPLALAPGYLPRALPWLWQFLASAKPQTVHANADRLHDLYQGSHAAHAALAQEVGVPHLLQQKGHLFLYPDDEARAKDKATWTLRSSHGQRLDYLDRAGIENLESGLPARYRSAVLIPDHATVLDPLRYVQAVVRAFVARGGELLRADVRTVAPAAGGGGWTLKTDGAPLHCDEVVVAAGAWAPRLLGTLGIKLRLESQRGYHVQYPGQSSLISRTVVLADKKVFMAPMVDGLRIGGTVEIAGLDAPPTPRRTAVLERLAVEVFPQLAGIAPQHWMGHRPCMPDSVPVIGPAPGHAGLWLAVGHGHLGLTGSVNTARRLADALMPG
ncbi:MULTISPECIES: FAD-binding oxidoreductase [unclassified Achromobacter]|uniref:NAD(P)/FAD-dependent oxidoreductase n=1 Tax=unclassified Achromobacter TaxID=2626865 RepID=UPI000B515B82|nr:MULTISPECIES: FAD-dependent oxidoreductase [unclassified Achromobacter]OWT77047.1 FAD-dependent oxidoreductase [Achromobacter sp. HZ28]OWT77928.1 FAD-dependent oxidoreductase [Achromobacter sp. HZ34]